MDKKYSIHEQQCRVNKSGEQQPNNVHKCAKTNVLKLILTPQFVHVPEHSAIYTYTIQYIYFSNTISQKPKTVTG